MFETRLFRPTLWRRSLALTTAFALLCSPVGGLLTAAQAQDAPPASLPAALPPPPDTSSPTSGIRIPMSPVQAGPIKTILLFPFANAIVANANGGFNPDVVGARVEDAVKMRLNIIGRYKANSFSPNLPQIQRALQESRVEGLTENDLTPPYNDGPKGDKIATQIGTDGYLLGTIDALNVDQTNRNVTLSVSATLYNTETGAVVKSLAYTGHGISYNATDNPDNLLQSAINDVAGHVVSALNADAVKKHPVSLAPADSVRGGHSSNGSFFVGLLLATALGFALSSGHHSSSGSSSSTGTTTGTGTGVPSPPVLTGGSGGTPPSPPL